MKAITVSRIRLQSNAELKAWLTRGPVIVQRRGKAVAVLLDPARWQELAERLEPDFQLRQNNQVKRR